jgi:hypothetical protein
MFDSIDYLLRHDRIHEIITGLNTDFGEDFYSYLSARLCRWNVTELKATQSIGLILLTIIRNVNLLEHTRRPGTAFVRKYIRMVLLRREFN